ncbi:MAG TPA: aminotransferase class I/II-fold pyridoxal phosphate-dependent enzyme [Gemmatimonadales bacterium]|jgi:8-amino-7-oxononanoate synthase|nr:aminotransferase class I/II-fold pyridoxal phosphate-dependent enzyme [Gemmatimonadales bacterium]
MDLLDKLRAVSARAGVFAGEVCRPFDTVFDDVLGPCEVVFNGRPVLMFGSNNYFGLSFHPEVQEAAKHAVERYGSGSTGSRVANGTLRIHEELERDFAAAFAKRHGMIFSTGFQANLCLVAGLCQAEDTILLDAACHASIYDGARLSGASVLAFRHNSAGDLAKKLARLPRGETNRLVIVEGLYSIHGDVAPLGDILAACRAGGAYLLVDEAHSFGVYGERGLGCAEAQGVLAEVDFVVGTFSKALAAVGGFAVSDHPELRALHFAARPYVFTASPSPATVAGVQAALRVLRSDRAAPRRLWENVRRMRAGLTRLGYSIGPVESPIVPILIGPEELTVGMWQALLEAGLYVNIVLPPGCPKGQCLLRTSYSSAHTPAQIDAALEILAAVGKQAGVLMEGGTGVAQEAAAH